MIAADNPLKAEWARICVPLKDWPGGASQVGLSIMVETVKGELTYAHNGSTQGYRADWAVSPRTRHVIVALANNDVLEPGQLIAALYQPRPSGPAGDFSRREETPIPASQLPEYVGIYSRPPGATNLPPPAFTVVLDNSGRLRLRIAGQRFGPLYYAGNDRFFKRMVAVEYQFSRGADGKISGVTLFQDGKESTAVRSTGTVPYVRFLEPAILRDYVGNYRMGPRAEMAVTAAGDQLFAKITGQRPLTVDADDQMDHFNYSAVKAELTFQRDEGGAVTGLVLHQNGRDLPASRSK